MVSIQSHCRLIFPDRIRRNYAPKQKEDIKAGQRDSDILNILDDGRNRCKLIIGHSPIRSV